MSRVFSDARLNEIYSSLNSLPFTLQPSPILERSPVHVVYGGAHLFKSDTPQKLGKIALKNLRQYAPSVEHFAEAFNLNLEIAETVFERVTAKLSGEAVEDFRIDFEDGYGFRKDAEEDADARQECRCGYRASIKLRP